MFRFILIALTAPTILSAQSITPQKGTWLAQPSEISTASCPPAITDAIREQEIMDESFVMDYERGSIGPGNLDWMDLGGGVYVATAENSQETSFGKVSITSTHRLEVVSDKLMNFFGTGRFSMTGLLAEQAGMTTPCDFSFDAVFEFQHP